MSKYIVYPPRVEGKPHIARIEHFNDLGNAIDFAAIDGLEIAMVEDQDSWLFKLIKWLLKL